jgi:dihydroorotate dehydrogenase electron transfer subunit
MVRCADGSPLLRRPFSIHRVSGLAGERVSGLIEILYEVVGSGTEILAQKKPGEWLDIIGPLGNGFDLNPLTGKPANRQTILIAGGIGVVPLVFLAEKLRNKKGSGPFLKPIVLIGAKTKSEILCEKEFKALGCNVRIATDDGTKGHKGFVTELLKKILGNSETQRSRGQVIYACGPQAMLKETAKIAVQHGLQCQVSLETHMACGIGACLGCVVNTKEGYRRVCKEGPVVDGSQIIW